MAFKKTDRLVSGFGVNSSGQLGINNVISMSSPIQIAIGVDWKMLSSGTSHVMGIKNDKTLWGWGSNSSGQLGVNDVSNRSSPTQVFNGGKWNSVAAGFFHSLAVKSDFTLWSMGAGSYGELGNGTTLGSNSPVQVSISAGTGWKQVAAGIYNSAAIKADGTLWAWGRNAEGQLGHNNTTNKSTPVQVGTNTNWKQISNTGYYHCWAIKTDGTLWAWGGHAGIGTDAGQKGLNSTVAVSSPTQVGLDTNWKVCAAINHASAAVKTDGTLWTCGYDFYGVLGDNKSGSSTINKSSPIQVTGTNWKYVGGAAVGSSGEMMFASKTDGTFWSWGNGGSGQLGNNSTLNRSSPVQISSDNWTHFYPGAYQSFAIKEIVRSEELPKTFVTKEYLNNVYPHLNPQLKSAGLWVWGNDTYGKLGDNSTLNKSSPVQTVAGGTNWKQCSTTYYTAGAIKTDGTLWTWGLGSDYGQLGIGLLTNTSTPVQVGTASDWKMVHYGNYFHAVAVKTDGTLWSWGTRGGFGTIGDGLATGIVSTPVQIGIGSTWATANAGFRTSHAIKTDGTLWGWGYNGGTVDLSLIGNNSTIDRSSPVQIGSASNWKMISMYYDHCVAVTNNNLLYTWGHNGSGEIGDSTVLNKLVPTQIGSNVWKTASTGQNFTIAIRTDGTMWSWGINDNGQLGDGTIVSKSSPVKIGVGTNWKSCKSLYVTNTALKTDGTLWSWGDGTHGVLGNGAVVSVSTPVQIGTATNWKSISGGAAISEFDNW